MNYLSIYSLFISILIVNCAKYDIELMKNSFKLVNCELNCLNKDDPLNVVKLLDYARNHIEFHHNFIQPTIEYCKKLNSNLLDNIKTNDDLSENFKTAFNQRKNIGKKEIDDIIEKTIGFNLTNYQIENKTDPFIDFILPESNYLTEFILKEHNRYDSTIYEEPQSCEIEFPGSTKLYFKFKTKKIEVHFDKVVSNYSFNRKISFFNLKEFEEAKYKLLNSEPFKKRILNYFCLGIPNINKEEYCN